MLLYEFFHALFVGVFNYFSTLLVGAIGNAVNGLLGLE
jgi:hypothetical protein